MFVFESRLLCGGEFGSGSSAGNGTGSGTGNGSSAGTQSGGNGNTGAGGSGTGGGAVSGFEYNGMKILFDDGQIKLIRDGKLLEHCRISEFSRHPNAVFIMLLKKAEAE